MKDFFKKIGFYSMQQTEHRIQGMELQEKEEN